MHGHTGGGHTGGGGHMPPAHHQPHHQVHSADNLTSMDRPHMSALATRFRNPKMAALTTIGVVLALLILLIVVI